MIMITLTNAQYFLFAIVGLFMSLVLSRFPYFASSCFSSSSFSTPRRSTYSPVLYKEGGVVLLIAYAAAVLGAFEFGLLSNNKGGAE